MSEFALVVSGQLLETRNLPERPPNIEHKSVEWFPVVREYGESFTGVDGDSYVFRTVDPATLPAPVPQSISDRQFFQQLAIQDVITEQEAENAVAIGEIPAAMTALIEMLPEQARFDARMTLKGATVFERHHEMVDTIAWLYGWTSEQVDDLFRAAGALI